MRAIAIILMAAALMAQRTPEIGIRAKDASTVGVLYFEDLTGNKLTHQVPTSLTAYALTWPNAISAGCLTANGSGTLTWQSCVSLPIDDSSALIKGSADATKLVRFEVDGLTTATTRVATFPNFNFIMAAKDVDNAFSSAQTFSVAAYSPLFEVSPSGGSPGFLTLKEAPANGPELVGLQAEDALSSNCIYRIGDLVFRPCVDNQTDLGSSSFAWKKGWMNDLDLNAGLTVGGNAGFAGNISFSGTATPLFSGLGSIGSASLPYGTINGSNIVAQSTFRLGSSAISGRCLVSDASGFGTWQACPGGGITNLNGLTVATQNFSFAASGGTNLAVSSAGVTHSFSVPVAGPTALYGLIQNSTQTIGGDKILQGSFYPSSSSTYSLGTSGFRWSDAWINTGQFTTVNATTGSFTNISANGTITIGTIQGVFSGTGFVGTSGSRIGNGYFSNLDVSQFGSLTAYVNTGDFHNKTFSGSPSCAGRTDGWTGVDTFNLRIWVCVGGTARWATLN